MPDNVVFELVIKGTPGTPEESDDHVLWIEADCPNTIRKTLSREAAQCVRSIVKLPGVNQNYGLDFSLSTANPTAHDALSRVILDRIARP